VQLVLITWVADPRVALALLPAAGAGCVVLALEAWWLVRRDREPAPAGPAEPTGRPFSLGPALVLAGIISAVLPLAV
jgi:hypothetical protein